MEKFNIESLYDKEIKVSRIYCYKGTYRVNGIIDDKYYIEACNGGEYRTELDYDINEKFTLKSFNYFNLCVKDEDNNTIYEKYSY